MKICKETVCSLSSKSLSIKPSCDETVKTKLINDGVPPKKMVRFSDESQIINEPEELIEYLAMARKSDFLKRQMDKERMERLLGPVLSKVHREKILKNNSM